MDPNNMKLPKPLDSRSGPHVKHNQPIRNAAWSPLPSSSVPKKKKKRKKEVVCIEKVEAGCTHHSGVAATRRKIDKILHNDKRTYLILDALIPFSIPKLKQKVVFYPQCICTVEICS